MAKLAGETLVTAYTHGLIGPETGFFAHVASGSRIRAVTPPGCWGPMITPSFKGGHEVTQPIYVEGAEIGDAVAIHIEQIRVVSRAASSGTMAINDEAYQEDPFVVKKCPGCQAPWPETTVSGIGEKAIRCAQCGHEASPFHFAQGYTVVFNEARSVGLMVNQRMAEEYAEDARVMAGLPDKSQQHSALVFAPHALTGTPVRVEPSIGNIGTMPAKTLPDSHNAGDFGAFLVGSTHDWVLSQEELDSVRTDAHLDCRDVREGAVLLCPVKVPGAGVYMGDAHAIMGRGEIAGHSIDVTADITITVEVIKGLELEGPILLPNPEDLPHIACPFADQERAELRALGRTIDVAPMDAVTPIQIIGTGSDLNKAVDNAVQRAASFLRVSHDEVLNRGTISGEVQITRLPGTVQLTLQVPIEAMDERGLGPLITSQYLNL